MAGIRFQSWEHFLHYVQKRESILQVEERRKASELFDADYLEADEWEGLQKMLSLADYEELTEKKRMIEVRSFHIPEETGRMIFYAVWEEDGNGGYLCMGYGFVEENETESFKGHYVPLPLQTKRKDSFCRIGTEQDYWSYYPALLEKTPGEVLAQVLSKVEIKDLVCRKNCMNTGT